MILTRPEPLSFYVDLINRHVPFTSLLYGDGEFLVAMRMRTGERMSYGEIVTTRMEDELRDSFRPDDPSIIRATDLNLIDYAAYDGNDYESVHAYGKQIRTFLGTGRDWTFYDGVIWEWAVRDGGLSPFLRALRARTDRVEVVGNRRLRELTWLNPRRFVEIPDTNAYGVIDQLERQMLSHTRPCDVYLVCAGLTTIPLIMRLRKAFPEATFLDLGSTFDLFVKLETRGWRVELYQDQKAYDDLVRRNLEGL